MCCCVEYFKPVDGSMKLFPTPSFLYHEFSSYTQLHINELHPEVPGGAPDHQLR